MSKDLRHVCQTNSTCPDIFCSGYENADFGAVLNNGAENPSATELVIHQVIRDDESHYQVPRSYQVRKIGVERWNALMSNLGSTEQQMSK